MTIDLWRSWIVDGPSSIVDRVMLAIVRTVDRVNRVELFAQQFLAPLWRAYWMLVAAASMVCITTTLLVLLATLLHVPVPLVPPDPLPVMPAGGRAAVSVIPDVPAARRLAPDHGLDSSPV